jgi:hypothetical protein
MIFIQPDRRLRGPTQVSGIGALVHNAEMPVRAPWVAVMMIEFPFADSIIGRSDAFATEDAVSETA